MQVSVAGQGWAGRRQQTIARPSPTIVRWSSCLEITRLANHQRGLPLEEERNGYVLQLKRRRRGDVALIFPRGHFGMSGPPASAAVEIMRRITLVPLEDPRSITQEPAFFSSPGQPETDRSATETGTLVY